MRISPINNSNKKNTNFGQLHRVQISHDFFDKSLTVRGLIDDFNGRIKVRTQELEFEFNKSISKKDGFLEVLLSTFKNSQDNSYLSVFETQRYRDLRIFHETNGYSSWWLPRRLEIDEPKPVSDKYHTFSIYTGEDNIKVKDLLNKKALKKMKETANEKAQEYWILGRCKKENQPFWEFILFSDELDNMFAKFTENRKFKEHTIDTQEKFTKFLDEAFPLQNR